MRDLPGRDGMGFGDTVAAWLRLAGGVALVVQGFLGLLPILLALTLLAARLDVNVIGSLGDGIVRRPGDDGSTGRRRHMLLGSGKCRRG